MNENRHLNIGMLWLERHRPEKAEPELRQAVAVDPDDPDCRARLALCLAQLGKFKDALLEAENAIGLDPEWDFPYSVRAIAFYGLGKVKQAETTVREAIELDPEDAHYRGFLSDILGHQKRWKEALEAAEEGLELDPEDESCASARAMALIQLGQAEDADLAMESALRKDPEDAEAHALMGWSKLHKGKADEAIEHYSEALKLDPTSEMARTGLVESLKARNFIYRIMLRYFLLLTRIKPRWVFAIMIGTIFIRYSLIEIAESSPVLGMIIWPVLYLLVAFILMTWVANPIFNLLLRFDRVGRHALTRKDIRQTNFLIGNLVVVAFFVFLWLYGVPGMVVAVLFSAMMIIPVMTTVKRSSLKPLLILGCYTLALAVVGAYNVYLIHEHDSIAMSLNRKEFLDESTNEISSEKVSAYIRENPSYANKLIEQVSYKKTLSEKIDKYIMYFIYGWVAFTWFSGFIVARDKSD
jgi:tetratricopeptide (TPR) repeat protein